MREFRAWRRRVMLLVALVFIPLVAYSLTLSDYLNESTVTASSDQFETVTSNNSDDIQIIPNAELIVVKQVINDDGGAGVLGDFGLATDAGSLVFDAGVTSGTTTIYTSSTLYVPPGSYSLTENDVDGYAEGLWACTAGTLDDPTFSSGQITLGFGEQTVCTIINDDISPTVTLVKSVTNDNGGNLAVADFDIKIDGVSVVSGSATPVSANTTINIEELLEDGYQEGTWSCTDATGYTSGLPTAGAATGTTFVLEEGSDVTCEITNNDVAPLLTLVKSVVNDNGGSLVVADFSLNVDAALVVSGTPVQVSANTPVVISETAENGYAPGTWSCVDANNLTAGLPAAGVASGETISLSQGADVTCSIVNDDVAPELTLTKTVINDDGGALTVSDFELQVDGTTVVSGASSTVLANTAITVKEVFENGYQEGTWSCVDSTGFTSGLPVAGAAGGESITLAPGAKVNCSISNNDIAPKLTLVKSVVNDNGGNLAVSDFTLNIDSTAVASGLVNTVSSNTVLNISEATVAGYQAGVWSCTDSTGFTSGLPTAGLATGEPITLAEGADVTCAISNDDISPTLTLTKTVVNDNGGDLVVSDFDLQIDSGSVVSGVVNTVLANTDINIKEIAVDGYLAGTWSCVDSNGLTGGLPTAGAAGGEILNLKPGSAVNCSISNDDIAPTLMLVKSVVNDNGGSLTVSDFALDINGSSVVSGAVNTQSANAVISISETLQDGYTAGTWSCVDSETLTSGLPNAGLATGTDLVLSPGSVVTCSIENNDASPKLTLVKNVTNDDGGILAVSDFTLQVDAATVASGSASLVNANTAIVISELPVDGYSQGNWSCSDANGFTGGLPTAGSAGGETITLAEGADVTCSITNNDIAPTLTLVKSVVNDDGGNLSVSDFELQLDNVPVVSGSPSTVVANTAIDIKELLVNGYQEGSWACTDANSLTTGLPTAGSATGEAITLASGADVTCSISNDDIAPSLSLTKTITNDNGGDHIVADVDLFIDTTLVASGVATTVSANAGILIKETLVDGYQEGTWSCVDSTGFTAGLPSAGLATGETITLAPGAVVDCAINNDDIAPTLQLVKNVVNDNGGSLVVSDFDLEVDGNLVTSGVASPVSSNTDIVISEVTENGYQEGTWSCVDSTGYTAGLPTAGAPTGETIRLEEGADVICTISNDDIAPTLTLTKTVVNDNGGSLAIADFELQVDTVAVSSGVATTVSANQAIQILELPVDGYQAGSWSCVDATGFTSGLPTAGSAAGENITLAPGAEVTCSVTNDDIAPKLTLTKLITNDDGGDLVVGDFDLMIDSGSVVSGVANTVSANTPIEIKETPVNGYAAGDWSCVDAAGLTSGLPTAGSASGEVFALAEGSDVTCSITNDDIAPTLVLSKTVINDNGGTLTDADFDLQVDGSPVVSGAVTTVVANTPILISEADVTAYAEGSWSCVDATGWTSGLPAGGLATGVSIELEPGAQVTCSITNDDQGIDLSIVKAVSDATPNIGQTITFTLTVTNAGPDVATNVSVGDLIKPGFTYVAGSITGGSTADDSTPTSGTGLSWTINSMAVGVPETLEFQAVVNAP